MSKTYIRVRSWHVLALVDATGWITRCGIRVVEDAPVADALPLDERSCESCLRLERHDAEKVTEATA